MSPTIEMLPVQIRVNLGSSHSDLYLGAGSRHELLGQLRNTNQRLIVISDAQVKSALDGGFLGDVPWLTVPAGEASKCVESAARLWSQLAEHKVDRHTGIVGIGGGVVGDLAGFVASTYLRGVPFYSFPTSLLAMVDASVGGKVGIDLPEGKNLVGDFYPAAAVAVDPELLSTLPGPEWASGMAEVVKHGILSGEALWKTVTSFSWEKAEQIEVLDHLVYSAVKVKLEVVQEDPYERTGLRATLNLGHTFGHALEWCSNYQLRHGEAVSLGLIAGLRLSRTLGLLEQDFETELCDFLASWSLPTRLPEPTAAHWCWEQMQEAFARDKKNRDGKWTFILPRGLGDVETVVAPDSEAVHRVFESLKKEPAAG